MEAAFDYVMVFSADTLPPARRRRGLAVEPMTCPPNAFQSGEGLRALQPGESFEASWGISPRR
jgi:aldose 1-epimerase